MMIKLLMKLCSACFLGVRCLWNGASRPNKKVINLFKTETLIPVCPEQLGGLSIPREPAHIVGSRVITRSGKDVTDNYIRGAEEALKICQLFGIKEAVLKQGSPSCGSNGICFKLLEKNDIKIKNQNQI